MKYAVFIVIGIVAIGLAAYFLFFRPMSGSPMADESGGKSTAAQTGTITPIDPASVPTGETIALGTPRGTITIRNFYKIAQGFDGDALVVRATPQYEIFYDKAESAFGIFILGGPVTSSERAAEDDLISILGVSRTQACLLRAVWSVSAALDKNLSGRNYPLSFCPGAVGF